MEATIRKDDNKCVTLILDGRLDTSVTSKTEKEVEPLYDFVGYSSDLPAVPAVFLRTALQII